MLSQVRVALWTLWLNHLEPHPVRIQASVKQLAKPASARLEPGARREPLGLDIRRTVRGREAGRSRGVADEGIRRSLEDEIVY